MVQKSKRRAEFGDFQTPAPLARKVCSLIRQSGFRPEAVIEPTCGTGAFIKAAAQAFPEAARVLGFDVNPAYVAEAIRASAGLAKSGVVDIQQADFFGVDWDQILGALPEPLLIVGNPPWVTNSEVGTLGGTNLPTKANLDGVRGIEALTGKSNFDISEWMLRRAIEWLDGRDGLLAVLCKTAVARKVLRYAWTSNYSVAEASLYRLDAAYHFDVSVDACLLLVRSQPSRTSSQCADYASLDASEPTSVFGLRDGQLVADMRLYDRWKHLRGHRLVGWRSGVKHDCSRIFELRREGARYRNGLDELVPLEASSVFPMLKSSDLARGRQPRRWMLVPQRNMADDTRHLKATSPLAWRYLSAHADELKKRASSIYRNRPEFAIFGVGPYSFSPWKAAISGLYKSLQFSEIAPFEDRPVILDDTCYFFPCDDAEECREIVSMLASEPAQEFLSAFVFWDSKRPITASLLNSLDLRRLAQVLGRDSDAVRKLASRQANQETEAEQQLLLFPTGRAGTSEVECG